MEYDQDTKNVSEKEIELGWTTIHHEARIKAGLTNNEYVLCDTIHNLSVSRRSRVPGWCYAKKETLAAFIGLSKRSIITLIGKMNEAGYIDKSEDGRLLKSTLKWEIDFIFTRKKQGEESSPRAQRVYNKSEESSPKGVKKVHQEGEESSPNKNIYIDKKKENNKERIKPIPPNDGIGSLIRLINEGVLTIEQLTPKQQEKVRQRTTSDTLPDKPKKTAPAKIKFEPPTLEEFLAHAKDKCKEVNLDFNETAVKLKFHSWQGNDWKTGKDKRITNWKSTLTNTLQFICSEKANPKARRVDSVFNNGI